MSRSLRMALAATLGLSLGAWGAPPTKEKSGTLPLPKGGKVTLEAYKGTIRIAVWDRDEVSLKARIEPDEHCSDDARKIDETEVEFEKSGSTVRIRSNYDKLKGLRGWTSGWFNGCAGNLPFVHYDVTVPALARVEVDDYKSEIRIAGLKGDLRLETYKGAVKLTGLEGALDLETYKGTVRAEVAMAKDVRVETYKGDVTLSIPKHASFELDARLQRKGSLDSDFRLASPARDDDDGHRTRGTVGSGGGPSVDLETYKGSFSLVGR